MIRIREGVQRGESFPTLKNGMKALTQGKPSPRHELGLLNVTIPEKYGGAGMSTVDEMVICEELREGTCSITYHMRSLHSHLDWWY